MRQDELDPLGDGNAWDLHQRIAAPPVDRANELVDLYRVLERVLALLVMTIDRLPGRKDEDRPAVTIALDRLSHMRRRWRALRFAIAAEQLGNAAIEEDRRRAFLHGLIELDRSGQAEVAVFDPVAVMSGVAANGLLLLQDLPRRLVHAEKTPRPERLQHRRLSGAGTAGEDKEVGSFDDHGGCLHGWVDRGPHATSRANEPSRLSGVRGIGGRCPIVPSTPARCQVLTPRGRPRRRRLQFIAALPDAGQQAGVGGAPAEGF